MPLALAGAVAQAAPVVYFGSLSGSAESPPTPSPAFGSAIVTINSVIHSMRVQVVFSGFVGTTTASHIHCCTALPGTSTAAIATTSPSFAGFPLGVTSGTFDQSLDLVMSSSFSPPFVTANGGTLAGAEAALLAGIAAGTAYIDVHSTFFPGGEIRSFLIPDLIFRNGLEPI